jgi:hypothetical protein
MTMPRTDPATERLLQETNLQLARENARLSNENSTLREQIAHLRRVIDNLRKLGQDPLPPTKTQGTNSPGLREAFTNNASEFDSLMSHMLATNARLKAEVEWLLKERESQVFPAPMDVPILEQIDSLLLRARAENKHLTKLILGKLERARVERELSAAMGRKIPIVSGTSYLGLTVRLSPVISNLTVE